MNGQGKPIFIRNLKNFSKDFDWQSQALDQYVSKSSPLSDSVNDSLSDLVSIKVQQLENFKNLIKGHLNINSFSNKFEMVVDIINNFGIFVIVKSKSNSSFPNSQSKINGYKIVDVIRTGMVGSSFTCKWRNTM